MSMGSKKYVRKLPDGTIVPNDISKEKYLELLKEANKNKRIIWVKKSLKDPTAALSYSLSVSILHLAMVVGLLLVKRPDLVVTEGMAVQCKLEAEDLEGVLQLFMWAHIMSFFATAYREMYSAKTDLFGQMMRILEVICIPVLLYAILGAIELVTLSLVRIFNEDAIADSDPEDIEDKENFADMKQGQKYLLAKCARKDWIKFQGHSFEWMLIEILVFATFLFTMIILMCKSRFYKVGIDGSGQFEPVYMRILAQKIADSIPINIDENNEFTQRYYLNSERIIQVENVAIKVCLNEQDFRAIEQQEPIKIEDAQAWISRCVVSRITKAELDNERK